MAFFEYEHADESKDKIDKILLEKFEIAIKKVFPNASDFISSHNLDLTKVIEPQLCQLALELRAYLTSERLSRIDVKYPKDWWQAFKERCFPKWLLEKFPVEYHEKRYDVRAFYPRVSLPQEKHYVRVFK